MMSSTMTANFVRYNWRSVATGVAAGIAASFVAVAAISAVPLSFTTSTAWGVTDTAGMLRHAETMAATAAMEAPRTVTQTQVRIVSSAPGGSSTPEVASTTYTIPEGTTVDVKIGTQVSSRDAQVGDAVTATTLEPITSADGRILFPTGTLVTGRVVEVKPAVETRSAAILRVAFHRIGGHDARIQLVTPDLAARARTANTAVDIGLVAGGAAAGAVIGHQVNHRRGSEIGAVVGGVAGAVTAANIGANVQLKLGETARLRFTHSVAVR